MDTSEELVYQYLISQGFASVVYEPDGKHPPDFLVDGRIAVEVRRLNQNVETPTGYCGIEELSKPLQVAVEKALAAMGPPIHGISWFVFYTFSRPLPPWKELRRLLSITLERVRDRRDLQDQEVWVTTKFRLSFTPASTMHSDLFILGGYADHNSGGFVISEMARNLEICIGEKTSKVLKVRSKYSEWWLAFDDRIGYGSLNEADLSLLRELIQPHDGWNKIILVNPLKPSIGYEL